MKIKVRKKQIPTETIQSIKRGHISKTLGLSLMILNEKRTKSTKKILSNSKKAFNILITNIVKVTITNSHTINHLTSFNYASLAINDTVINNTGVKATKIRKGQKLKFP